VKAASVSVGTFPSETMVRILVPEKVVAHLLVIRLEVLLNVENESGCNHGEQTGMYPRGNQINTARTDICAKSVLTKIGVRAFIVFLRGVAVVLVGFTLELTVEFDASGTVSSEEGGREGGMVIALVVVVPSKLENENEVSKSLETGGQLDAWSLGLTVAPPVVCYEEQGEV